MARYRSVRPFRHHLAGIGKYKEQQGNVHRRRRRHSARSYSTKDSEPASPGLLRRRHQLTNSPGERECPVSVDPRDRHREQPMRPRERPLSPKRRCPRLLHGDRPRLLRRLPLLLSPGYLPTYFLRRPDRREEHRRGKVGHSMIKDCSLLRVSRFALSIASANYLKPFVTPMTSKPDLTGMPDPGL